jgi:hypothetical protein
MQCCRKKLEVASGCGIGANRVRSGELRRPGREKREGAPAGRIERRAVGGYCVGETECRALFSVGDAGPKLKKVWEKVDFAAASGTHVAGRAQGFAEPHAREEGSSKKRVRGGEVW